jgi:hypothetical protein
MAISNETQVDPEWEDDESELELGMSEEDDLDFTEIEDDVEVEFDADGADSGEKIPLWRLIEMSSENRRLKMELADFEDYDFEDFNGVYAE